MSSAWVTQNGTETELTIWPGENLLEALRRGGFFVNAVCGGKGTCGKCRVILEGKDAARESVLACQTVFSDSIRRILLPEDDSDSMDVETSGREGGSPVIPLPRRKKEGGAEDRYGVCVDLGTTTVVTELYSLTEGRQAGQRSGRNRQSVYGADVISRIQYIQEHEDGLEELTVCIRRQIFDMMREICREAEIPEDRVTEMSLAGNTIMQHIFAGLSPVSIASAPFRPETLFLDGTALDGGSWDLPAENPVCWPGLTVRLAPCASGYVGGDIVAGLLAADARKHPGRYLFLDVGTNGEMALGGQTGLVCCSVASGPAFEGGELTCGMTSTAGAVNRVVLTPDGRDIIFDTIRGEPPKGICGSGLIDLLAVLLRTGIVNAGGRMLPPGAARAGGAPEPLCRRLTEDENGNGAFWLDAGHRVGLTAGDVRKLQLAKAAIMAGIRVMMRTVRAREQDIRQMYIAGGFGRHLNPDSACAVGMIPEGLRDRITYLGNASLEGARKALLEEGSRIQLMNIARQCHYLELSGNAAFNEEYMEQMSFGKEE